MEDKFSFINRCLQGSLMKRGNGQRSLKHYYAVLEFIRVRTTLNPLIVILYVLETFRPSVNLWSKKVGGTTYKIPYVITNEKGLSMAIHSLVKESRIRYERDLVSRVGGMIVECVYGRYQGLQRKRDEIHRTALNNRAFLRLR